MEFDYKIIGTNLIIKLPTDLDCHNAPIFREEADKVMLQRNINSIVFDFKQTRFMDSTGIGAIIGRYKKVHLVGGNAIAIHVNEQVERVLTLSGVHRLIPINKE